MWELPNILAFDLIIDVPEIRSGPGYGGDTVIFCGRKWDCQSGEADTTICVDKESGQVRHGI